MYTINMFIERYYHIILYNYLSLIIIAWNAGMVIAHIYIHIPWPWHSWMWGSQTVVSTGAFCPQVEPCMFFLSLSLFGFGIPVWVTAQKTQNLGAQNLVLELLSTARNRIHLACGKEVIWGNNDMASQNIHNLVDGLPVGTWLGPTHPSIYKIHEQPRKRITSPTSQPPVQVLDQNALVKTVKILLGSEATYKYLDQVHGACNQWTCSGRVQHRDASSFPETNVGAPQAIGVCIKHDWFWCCVLGLQVYGKASRRLT